MQRSLFKGVDLIGFFFKIVWDLRPSEDQGVWKTATASSVKNRFQVDFDQV